MDVQSVLIYGGAAVVSFLLAACAGKTRKRGFVWLIVLMLALISGLRSFAVGIDTQGYYDAFQHIAAGDLHLAYAMETGFKYICLFLMKIWHNGHFLFFVFAFFSHALVLFRLWDEREYISYPWAVTAYYVLFFPFSLNGLRQFIAVALVFYATRYMKRGRYLKGLVFVAIAMLFHTSALVGAAYIVFDILFTRYFNQKRKLIVQLFVILTVVAGVSLTAVLLNRYGKYFAMTETSLGVMLFAKVFLFAVSAAVLHYRPLYAAKDVTPVTEEEAYFRKSCKWYYLVGILLTFAGYFFLYVGRVGLFFYIFEANFIGSVFKTRNRNGWLPLLKGGFALILFYYLVVGIASGAQGEIPYRFFWQG